MEQNNPFISSALIVGFIVAIISSAAALFMSYSVIGSEPGTSTMIMMSAVGLVSCIVGIFAGMFAVRHHVKIYNTPLAMGRGAVIGLTSGAFVAIFASAISLLWMLIDPAFTDKLMEAMVRSMESIPGAEAQVDAIYEQFQSSKTFAGQAKSLGINLLVMGALNAITGILGVKFFAPKPADTDAL